MGQYQAPARIVWLIGHLKQRNVDPSEEVDESTAIIAGTDEAVAVGAGRGCFSVDRSAVRTRGVLGNVGGSTVREAGGSGMPGTTVA